MSETVEMEYVYWSAEEGRWLTVDVVAHVPPSESDPDSKGKLNRWWMIEMKRIREKYGLPELFPSIVRERRGRLFAEQISGTDEELLRDPASVRTES
jgi:hypothetical protein